MPALINDLVDALRRDIELTRRLLNRRVTFTFCKRFDYVGVEYRGVTPMKNLFGDLHQLFEIALDFFPVMAFRKNLRLPPRDISPSVWPVNKAVTRASSSSEP
ncbi:MAG: hypothetical protein WCD69_22980 [Xanthobacteraceae bacterium]